LIDGTWWTAGPSKWQALVEPVVIHGPQTIVFTRSSDNATLPVNYTLSSQETVTVTMTGFGLSTRDRFTIGERCPSAPLRMPKSVKTVEHNRLLQQTRFSYTNLLGPSGYATVCYLLYGSNRWVSFNEAGLSWADSPVLSGAATGAVDDAGKWWIVVIVVVLVLLLVAVCLLGFCRKMRQGKATVDMVAKKEEALDMDPLPVPADDVMDYAKPAPPQGITPGGDQDADEIALAASWGYSKPHSEMVRTHTVSPAWQERTADVGPVAAPHAPSPPDAALYPSYYNAVQHPGVPQYYPQPQSDPYARPAPLVQREASLPYSQAKRWIDLQYGSKPDRARQGSVVHFASGPGPRAPTGSYFADPPRTDSVRGPSNLSASNPLDPYRQPGPQPYPPPSGAAPPTYQERRAQRDQVFQRWRQPEGQVAPEVDPNTSMEMLQDYQDLRQRYM